MNLQKLFEAQAELDKHIIEKKGLQGVDLLPNLILALQVELAECAQESRCFKFWSNNREPRLKAHKKIKCKWCNGSGDDGTGVCPDCMSTGDVYKEYNPLLEEYVDCLHFILSIGNNRYGEEIKLVIEKIKPWKTRTYANPIVYQFLMLFEEVGRIDGGGYTSLFCHFLGLGEMLGFTWEQIEAAYFEKNAVNHSRQENGY